MTNFQNKKLSQIEEEEEEAISNLEHINKSGRHFRELQTGINNNVPRDPRFNTELNSSKRKSAIPLLKAGFKTAYEGHFKEFLTNGDVDIMRNLNTMQVNGKNFHMFQTLRASKEKSFEKNRGKRNAEFTANDILDQIREESQQRNTVQTVQSRKQMSSFQTMTAKDLPRQSRPQKQRRFFTGEGLLGLNFKRNPQQPVFTHKNKMNHEPVTVNRFFTKDPNTRPTFNEEQAKKEQERMKSQSISVTNNDITNNNHNVNINNKMSTYIIIMNDEKKQKELSEKFSSKQQAFVSERESLKKKKTHETGS